jgi:hypothetical protein
MTSEEIKAFNKRNEEVKALEIKLSNDIRYLWEGDRGLEKVVAKTLETLGNKYRDFSQNVADSTNAAVDSIATNMIDVLDPASQNFRKFSQAMTNIGNQIRRELINTFVIKPVIGQMTGAFESMLGGGKSEKAPKINTDYNAVLSSIATQSRSMVDAIKAAAAEIKTPGSGVWINNVTDFMKATSPATYLEKRQAEVEGQKNLVTSGERTGLGGPVTAYDELIKAASEKHEVDANLIKAVIAQESSFKPDLVGKKGELGLMQLMPDTISSMRFSYPKEHSMKPEVNIDLGTRYLKKMSEEYANGNEEKTLWAYNAGPGNMQKGIKPQSTREHYIPEVMERVKQYRSQAVTEEQPMMISKNMMFNKETLNPTGFDPFMILEDKTKYFAFEVDKMVSDLPKLDDQTKKVTSSLPKLDDNTKKLITDTKDYSLKTVSGTAKTYESTLKEVDRTEAVTTSTTEQAQNNAVVTQNSTALKENTEILRGANTYWKSTVSPTGTPSETTSSTKLLDYGKTTSGAPNEGASFTKSTEEEKSLFDNIRALAPLAALATAGMKNKVMSKGVSWGLAGLSAYDMMSKEYKKNDKAGTTGIQWLKTKFGSTEAGKPTPETTASSMVDAYSGYNTPIKDDISKPITDVGGSLRGLSDIISEDITEQTLMKNSLSSATPALDAMTGGLDNTTSSLADFVLKLMSGGGSSSGGGLLGGLLGSGPKGISTGGGGMNPWGIGDGMPGSSLLFHTGGLVMHEGGIVPSFIPRFHGGAELTSDERVIIGQTGERMMSRKQASMFEDIHSFVKDSGKNTQPVTRSDTIQHFNIYTMDTVTMRDWVMSNKSMFADASLAAMRENHPLRRGGGK